MTKHFHKILNVMSLWQNYKRIIKVHYNTMKNRFLIMAFLIVSLCGCNDTGRNKSSNSSSYGSDVRSDHTFNVSYKSLDEAETKLLEILGREYGHPDTSSNYAFYDEFIDFVMKEPQTIDYPFEKLLYNGYADVVTSEDGNLRLYYWDTRFGGTWINWSNICQYRSNNKVYTHKCSILDFDHEGNIGQEYDNECATLGIKTIYDDSNNPIYIVRAYIRFSSNWGWQSAVAVKIKDDKLVTVPIFQGGIDIYADEEDEIDRECYRDVEYSIADWYFRANDGEGWDWLFRYDDKTEILYVPQVDYPQISDRYSLYQYDGENLCYIGTDGGFWIHPSIRSFKFLELVMDTKDYKIRIDRMLDDSYRYASWNNCASMDNLPDLIVYDGVYDEDKREYSFKHNGYDYIVKDNSKLIVKCRGKVILSQESLH